MSNSELGITFIYPNNCGNSPKTVKLKELYQSLIAGNLDLLIESVDDEVLWTLIGDSQIKGKQNLIDKVESYSLEQIDSLVIKSIITHGKLGSVSGKFTLKEDTRDVHFSTTFLFSSVSSKSKIIEIDTYIIRGSV
ncbi:ketosteroid isomerase family protein [Alkalicoccobacillus gibsonii]|uniref:Ketosteroid isomerase family protein n=1 Tax=Alkalicoccobacillus gibsonii TaxID=79881 RepID=A0ABU9VH72_9BACI